MATVARDQGYPEWACFIAQQAAEKGLKAVLHARGVIAWGHAITDLLRAYQEYQPVPLDP
jgi:HEPN domain-containing protein